MSTAIPLHTIRSNEDRARFFTEDTRQNQDPNGNFPLSISFDQDARDLEDINSPTKRMLYQLLEQPTSSPSAFLVHLLMTFLIVTSAVVTVLETVPAFHSINGRVWFGLETTLVALFTVEYVTRCVAWSGSWMSLFKWASSFFGIIDLLAILPYYIEIMLQQDTSVFFRFSILRMFRLLRVFRPFRYNHTILLTIEVMYLSVRRSQHALFAIGFFVVMVLTVFSTLLYFAERGTWDNTLETFINSDGDPTQFAV
jgi:potassium voltage-gated channel Shal-related subfamily D protein 2